jgi:hypothetical protein
LHTREKKALPPIIMLHRTLFLLSLSASVDAWGYCNDYDLSCANWAKAGECDKDHVKKLCPHSCAICPHICRDLDEQCPQWKASGECESNVAFMYQSCSVTCGVCKVRCYDKDALCPTWARDGECHKNSGLYELCPVSCGTCTDMCLDRHNDCPGWAASGQCGTNAGYMLRTCPHSCGVCDETSHAASSHPVADAKETTADGRRLTERHACADHDRNQCLIWCAHALSRWPCSHPLCACGQPPCLLPLVLTHLTGLHWLRGEHECENNPAAVMKMCPSMCGLCTGACEDKYADCPNWAMGKKSWSGSYSNDGCEQDAKFMLPNCPHSCGICPRLHTVPVALKDEM